MRDQILRLGILLFPDAQVERAAIDVGRDVHAALLFREREARGVPAVCVLPRRLVDRAGRCNRSALVRECDRVDLRGSGLPHTREIRAWRPCLRNGKAPPGGNCCARAGTTPAATMVMRTADIRTVNRWVMFSIPSYAAPRRDIPRSQRSDARIRPDTNRTAYSTCEPDYD